MGSVERLIILGATGDLAQRYLFPGLAELAQRGALPADVRIFGVGRHELSAAEFSRLVAESIARHARGLAPAAAQTVLDSLDYRSADVTDRDALARVMAAGESPAIVYLALPPVLFEPVVSALGASGQQDRIRLVIEKPFGEDLASARRVNTALAECFAESAVHRVDHFLHLPSFLNVLGVRFANPIFEPLWNSTHVERVEIIWDEELTVEDRAGYYDQAGALRDMVQNHLLQMLCLVAMEPPGSLHEGELRDRKLEVLRAVRRFDPEEVTRHTARARYTAGRVGSRDVPDYVDEPGVDPDRDTETFAAVTLFVDNRRWAGVPFGLRTGKALGVQRREIAVHLRPATHTPFGANAGTTPNVLRFGMDPDALSLTMAVNGLDDPFGLQTVELRTALSQEGLSAYARVLLDAFAGEPALFVRGDEAEEAWSIVEPIIDAWRAGRPPLGEYPAGSGGPGA